jgi:hypothetical protein
LLIDWLLALPGAGEGPGGPGPGGRPLLLGADGLDEAEPGPDHAEQALAIEAVEAAAPLAADLDQAGLRQHAEMAGGGPAVAKARRQIARRQLAAEVAEDEDDVAPRHVREGPEDRLGVSERDAWRHTGSLSTEDND